MSPSAAVPSRTVRYESVVGTFDNALPLDTSFFRESWGELERLVGDADRDAPIMTYCTGGIRCVKASFRAYLVQSTMYAVQIFFSLFWSSRVGLHFSAVITCCVQPPDAHHSAPLCKHRFCTVC